jgi:glycosyltransferase involved in cell wall biosynthesis
MKVCLITPLFDPWLIGGVENYVAMLAYNLADLHEVVVITTMGPTKRAQNKPHSNPKIIEIRTKNICSLYDIIHKSSSIGIAKKSLWHILDLWNILSYKQIKKILDKEKPNLVHSNGSVGFSCSIFSAIKHSKIPHIHTLHGYQLISPWSSLFRKGKPILQFNILDRIYTSYTQRISSSVNAVISPSKFLIDFHIKLGFFAHSKKYVVPNGIALHYGVLPKEKSGQEFLFMGQIVEHKGLEIAIKAFRKIKEKNAKFHVIGDGSYIETAKVIAKGDERIIFHGFIENNKDLEEIFNRCSYAIFPSIWYEIFGLVIIECLDRGLPVIASNIGAIPELIQEGYNGFLFEPGDIDSLYHIIEKLLNQKTMLYPLSRNAIDSSKRFSIEKHLRSIMDIYINMLAK